MQVSVRHHYTPRYYLKRFEDAAGALWRLESKTGTIVRGNNDRFGFKKGWNTLKNPPSGYAPDWAEKQIAQVDGYAAAILTRILAGDLPDDIRPLAYAISFMQHNQPQVMGELHKKHPEAIRQWTDDYRLVVKMRTALDNAASYVPVCYAVKVIDEAETEARFLTSSNPLIDFERKPTMFFPISSRHSLFLSHDPAHSGIAPRFVPCDRSLVAEINKLTLKNSWQYVYSSKPDFSP